MLFDRGAAHSFGNGHGSVRDSDGGSSFGGNTYGGNSYGNYSAPSGNFGGYSAPAGAPASDFAMLDDDDAQLPF